MIVLICDLDNRNTFCKSPNQGLLLITEYVIALIGDCESVCGSYTIAAAAAIGTHSLG